MLTNWDLYPRNDIGNPSQMRCKVSVLICDKIFVHFL